MLAEITRTKKEIYICHYAPGEIGEFKCSICFCQMHFHGMHCVECSAFLYLLRGNLVTKKVSFIIHLRTLPLQLLLILGNANLAVVFF